VNYNKLPDIWFISDTHFSHHSILTFTGKDGLTIRNGFDSVEEMDEKIIDNWNKVVTPQHKIYHLGDVVFGGVKNLHRIMPRLLGKKRLIVGNHDNYKMSEYEKYFQKIYSWRSFGEFAKPFVACHYPLHYNAFNYRRGNPSNCVHGHIHEKLVTLEGEALKLGIKYANVCVEHRNYGPVHIEDLMKELA
jgi:calcineurin-like phosphoesterase family protein